MASPVLRGGGRLVNEEGDIPMTLADKAGVPNHLVFVHCD
jgi:hypothetical protein